MRQTSNSFRVRGSTPLAWSMSITAESTAARVRKVSSEKSAWPGVSTRFSAFASCSNCSTEEVTEIPRSCSIFIQSEMVRRVSLLAFTAPAR